ncbi:MAG: hypothetical protein A2Y24_07940 [Clostridiales bacterium GWE2_32_10]|nr:MAG: hypothetical protein A2Y24_07940 [Clostridiales bacterium GWE2_32_10]HBY20542.1 endolytic transglycosylase MltG [Clostridiales bacterium]
MKGNIKLILWIIVIVIIFICGYNYILYLYKNVPTENSRNSTIIEITIPKGAATKGIAKVLKLKNLIINEDIFRLKSKLYHYDGKYNSGMFELSMNMTNEQIMKYLITEKGRQKLDNRLTVPEGYTIAQIGKRLEEKGICTVQEFIDEMNIFDTKKYRFLNNLPTRANKLEGYLFPNTYDLSEKVNAKEVISKMLESFDKHFKPEYHDKAIKLGYTVDQVITIASIIEREVKKPEERRKVAGVMYNRLKKGMKLEMCSTVQYAQGKIKERLYDKDLEIDSPYNTYKNNGLPIGPISNPGMDSILAALYPEENDYYYFVLKNEKTGEHQFSKTFEEHVKAKKQWLVSSER